VALELAKVKHPIETIPQTDTRYPQQLNHYLKANAPKIIWTRGNLSLLTPQHRNLTALFCSNRCPAEIILKTHELAHQFRDSQTPTIGGYHSPIENEWLRVLLRGPQPIILCPARSIQKIQLSPQSKKRLAENQLLILSPFKERHKRSTTELATRRNLFAAALADKIFIAHAAENSQTLQFAHTLLEWGKLVFTFDSYTNHALLELGVQKLKTTK